MTIPTIISAEAIAPKTLLVHFSDRSVRRYDVSNFLQKNIAYTPLQYFSFLKSFTIEPGGYALSWNDQLDIAEYEIWKNGELV